MSQIIHQLHLGLGQFFRGHQAVYTQNSRETWNIAAVSMRTDTSVRQMRAQENIYHVLSRDKNGSQIQKIDCVKESLFLGEDYQRIVEILCSEDLEIVSFTITEKGYCFDFSQKKLVSNHPEIRSDLEQSEKKTAIGLIALAIEKRFNSHKKPFTLLSCDNVSFNGDVLKSALSEYLESSSSLALEWFKREIQCPNTMVDRIIPKTSKEEKTEALKNYEFDPLVILTESFSQWCIEDKFSSLKPEWPGVQWVDDIEPFEHLKLRTLNGSHTYLTYLGRLKNYNTVDQAIADEEIRADIKDLYMKEVFPTLKSIDKDFFINYKNQLIERFENPSLKHQLEQIAMDGSQKIPQRWLPVRAENPDTPIIQKGFCHWALFLYRKLKCGEKIYDPIADQLSLTESPRDFLKQLTQVIPETELQNEYFLKVYDERCERFL